MKEDGRQEEGMMVGMKEEWLMDGRKKRNDEWRKSGISEREVE